MRDNQSVSLFCFETILFIGVLSPSLIHKNKRKNIKKRGDKNAIEYGSEREHITGYPADPVSRKGDCALAV